MIATGTDDAEGGRGSAYAMRAGPDPTALNLNEVVQGFPVILFTAGLSVLRARLVFTHANAMFLVMFWRHAMAMDGV